MRLYGEEDFKSMLRWIQLVWQWIWVIWYPIWWQSTIRRHQCCIIALEVNSTIPPSSTLWETHLTLYRRKVCEQYALLGLLERYNASAAAYGAKLRDWLRRVNQRQSACRDERLVNMADPTSLIEFDASWIDESKSGWTQIQHPLRESRVEI